MIFKLPFMHWSKQLPLPKPNLLKLILASIFRIDETLHLPMKDSSPSGAFCLFTLFNLHINQMAEGAERRRRQIRLDYEKERAEIERERLALAATNREAGTADLNEQGLTV